MEDSWLTGRSRKGTSDDSEAERKPLGAAGAVRNELAKLAGFLETAQPKGPAPKKLFASVRSGLDDWHELVATQQWDELSQQVGKALAMISKSAENAGLVADLTLAGQLQQRLLTLKAAAEAASH
jgi:hypothetical protein